MWLFSEWTDQGRQNWSTFWGVQFFSVNKYGTHAYLILVSCPDHTSHKETGLVNQLEFLGPITGMW